MIWRLLQIFLGELKVSLETEVVSAENVFSFGDDPWTDEPASKFENFPAELRRMRSWVLWKLESRPGSPKPTKVPYSAAGFHASSTDPKTWSSFDDAERALNSGKFSGVGCMIVPPFIGIDFDNVRNPETGAVLPWAEAWIAKFSSYAELSPSGRGYHIWVKSDWRGNAKTNAIEIYSSSRYFTCTGDKVEGTPSTVNSVSVETLESLRAFAESQRTACGPRGALGTVCDKSESGKDDALIRELLCKLQTRDADKLESGFRERFAERYSARNRAKGLRSWDGKRVNYVRYSVERFLKRTAVQ
jgi:hypothetical protein